MKESYLITGKTHTGKTLYSLNLLTKFIIKNKDTIKNFKIFINTDIKIEEIYTLISYFLITNLNNINLKDYRECLTLLAKLDISFFIKDNQITYDCVINDCGLNSIELIKQLKTSLYIETKHVITDYLDNKYNINNIKGLNPNFQYYIHLEKDLKNHLNVKTFSHKGYYSFDNFKF